MLKTSGITRFDLIIFALMIPTSIVLGCTIGLG
jgi:hypothetical protein